MQTPEDRFEYAVAFLLTHEGGFADNKYDPGGATKYGISLRYLKATGIDINLDGKIDITDILALNADNAKHIYKRYWWDKYKYEGIKDSSIGMKIFDLAVNMGATQSHKLAQRAIQTFSEHLNQPISIDGKLGKETFECINYLCELGYSKQLLDAIKKQCIKFYNNLVIEKPELLVFLTGWLRRATD